MLIGIDTVLSWLESNNTPYWNVKSGGGEKSFLLCSSGKDEGETLSLNDSLFRLREALGRLGNGNYFIQAWTTWGQKKNWFSSNFQITSSSQPTAINPVAVSGTGITPADMQKAIADALAAERTANRLAQLEKDLAEEKKKNKEFEKESGGFGPRIAEKLIGLVDIVSPGTLNTHGAQPNVISGGGNVSDDDTERIGSLVEEWAKTDPDFENTLAGIVRLAKSNPAKYNMGKNILKS